MTKIWKGEGKLGSRVVTTSWFTESDEDQAWLKHFINDAETHFNGDWSYTVTEYEQVGEPKVHTPRVRRRIISS